LVVTGGAQTIEFADGTVSAPSITNSGDTNTGIYFPAADTIAFTEGGVESMRIDSAGNLGLGVTPSAWGVSGILQLGRTALSGGANAVGSSLSWNAYYDTSWKYYDSLQASQYSQANGVHSWFTAPSGTAGNAITFTQAMTLDASGNFGVGATPTAFWSGSYINMFVGNTAGGAIAAGTSASRNCVIAGNGTSAYLANEANGPIIFNANGVERARFTAGGNLGIGTTNPAFPLDIFGTTGAMRINSTTATNSAYLYTTNGGGDFYYGKNNSSGSDFGGTGYAAVLYSSGNYPMQFHTNSTERMRITSDGFLCLGTTSKNTDGLLSISADSSFNQGITIKDTNAANIIYYIYFTNSSGNGAGRIEHTGATTVSYVTSSDARLKTNIVDSGSAQSIIESIKIREFDWVSGEHQRFGVVAQELIDVAPEAVSVGRKEDDSWGVDYSKLVPHLIKYVQEQQAIITQLQLDVAALKGAA
jgi:hypothetical protein